jgi:hypothetical protein
MRRTPRLAAADKKSAQVGAASRWVNGYSLISFLTSKG